MRYLVGMVLALAFGVMGCSETSGTSGAAGDGGSGGDGGVGGDAGSAGVGGGGVGGQGGGETGTLTILPMELDADGAQVPLAGVSVCEIDTDNCGVTDGVNALKLQMPAAQEISYTQVKDGYESYLRPDVLKPEPGLNLVVPVMRTSAFIAGMHAGLMSPYPPEGTGGVFITVWTGTAGGSISGATVELVDGAGKTFYVDDHGTWRSDLAATTSAGGAGFVEVSPGEVQVRIGGTAKDCEVIRGWPGDEANTVRMLVREGFTTAPRVLCSVE